MKRTFRGSSRSRGRVLYDGQCAFCTSLVRRFERPLARRGFETLPLQTAGVRESLGLDDGSLLDEMRVQTESGRLYGGADAIIYLAGRIWWASPLFALADLPGMRRVLRAGHRWVAARRACISGACSLPGPVGEDPLARGRRGR